MRKFFLTLAAFGLFTLLVYAVLIPITEKVLPEWLRPNLVDMKGARGGFTWTRFREIDTVKKVDVLVMGSSHAYRGYDPRIFEANGYSMFNLGSTAQTPLQTAYLFSKYIDKLQPRIVILDVFPKVLNSDGVESSIDLISNMPFSFGMAKLVYKSANVKVLNTYTNSFWENTLGLDNKFHESRKAKADTFVGHGFVQSFAKIAQNKIKKSNDVYSFSDEQYESIQYIIDGCKKRNIDLYICQAPILPLRYATSGNTESIDSVFHKMSNAYYNFNKGQQWSDTLFIDDSHLNQYGVDRYNNLVLNSLKGR